jgi:hypothetical protein
MIKDMTTNGEYSSTDQALGDPQTARTVKQINSS